MKKIHLLIIIPIVVSILMSITLAIYDLYFYKYDVAKESVLPTPTTVDQEVSLTLNNYIVFDMNELDFKFMVVDVTLNSADVMDMTFNDIYTSENVFLSNYPSYVEKLTKQGLDINIQNVDFDVPKDMSQYTVRLFVPILDSNLKTVELIFGRYDNVKVSLDLSVVTGTKEMLGYNAQDESKIARIDAGSIQIMDVADFTGKTLYETVDGTATVTEFPQTAKIHSALLNLKVNEEKSITITSAKYIFTNSKKENEALPARISVEEFKNILGQKISSDTSAYLFFDLYSSASTLMEEPAYLELTLDGVSEPLVFTLIQ